MIAMGKFSPRPALFCRRKLESLWRRAVSTARARFRGNPARRRHLPRLAAEIRCVRAILRRSRKAFSRAWPGRTRTRLNHRAVPPYPYPPVTHEPKIAALSAKFSQGGLHPFHLPLGILLDEKDGKPTPTSICIRCDAFDGFPCLLNGKADAQVICVDPTLAAHPNFYAAHQRLCHQSSIPIPRMQRSARSKCIRNGTTEIYAADIVVVACGALILRSAAAAFGK